MLTWINSPLSRSSTFLFLDRDGVINEDRSDYIKNWDEYRFYPDALEALAWLNEHEIEVILVSNQSALNRGFMHWEDFWQMHGHMLQSIQKSGGDILAAFYCPHRPDENCYCRKPSPGMILSAASIYDIPLERTCLIGDRQTDLDAARQAGCKGILLERNPCTEGMDICISSREKLSPPRFSSLLEAVLALFQEQ